jgi:hypothetical protein
MEFPKLGWGGGYDIKTMKYKNNRGIQAGPMNFKAFLPFPKQISICIVLARTSSNRKLQTSLQVSQENFKDKDKLVKGLRWVPDTKTD